MAEAKSEDWWISAILHGIFCTRPKCPICDMIQGQIDRRTKMSQTRAEYLEWAKKRALEYVDRGDLNMAAASIITDLNNNEDTRSFAAVMTTIELLVSRQLSTAEKMRKHIEGLGVKTPEGIVAGLQFGLTDDKARFDKAAAYLQAALLDSWIPEDQTVADVHSLVKEGYKLSIVLREKPSSAWAYQVSLNIWGPDRLVIRPPDTYDWATIMTGIRRCNECQAEGVETFRYSFAGRVCAACLPKMQAEHERPGWTS